MYVLYCTIRGFLKVFLLGRSSYSAEFTVEMGYTEEMTSRDIYTPIQYRDRTETLLPRTDTIPIYTCTHIQEYNLNAISTVYSSLLAE